jgi:hypothetical protein
VRKPASLLYRTVNVPKRIEPKYTTNQAEALTVRSDSTVRIPFLPILPDEFKRPGLKDHPSRMLRPIQYLVVQFHGSEQLYAGSGVAEKMPSVIDWSTCWFDD